MRKTSEGPLLNGAEGWKHTGPEPARPEKAGDYKLMVINGNGRVMLQSRFKQMSYTTFYTHVHKFKVTLLPPPDVIPTDEQAREAPLGWTHAWNDDGAHAGS